MGLGMNVFSARRTRIVIARCHVLAMQILTDPVWQRGDMAANTRNHDWLALVRNTLAVLMNIWTAKVLPSAS